MRNKSIFIFLVMIFLASCAALTVTPQTLEVSETSKVLTATPTSTQTAIPTLTQTPEPALPTYGEIDPKVADKLKAEGINIPEELSNPEYDLKMATEFFQTHWCTAFGDLSIPISTVPENGIAYGPSGIKGIGMTEEACTAYAEQHIKYMWIHYREFGNPADREITLEQYVELLKQGRGGFEIPQYNPETGFFDAKKKMVNPLAGFTKIISDNTFKELPRQVNTGIAELIYVDKYGMPWIAGNDLEFTIEPFMSPNANYSKGRPYVRGPNLAIALISATTAIGINSNQCLATPNVSVACAQDRAKIAKKYREQERPMIWKLYDRWLASYEAGDHNAQPPMWIDD